MKIGNPTTTPSPTSAKRGTSRSAGSASRRHASRTAARAAATSARPRPTNGRVEVLDGEPGRRQRERERQHAHEAPRDGLAARGRRPPPTPAPRAGRRRSGAAHGRPPARPRRAVFGRSASGLRYRAGADSVTRVYSCLTVTTATIVTALEAEALLSAPGDRLPSVRTSTARYRAGPATVQRAVIARELVARGLVEARPGRGRSWPTVSPPNRPNWSWQTVALGGRAIKRRREALETLLRPPSPSTLFRPATCRGPAADRGPRCRAGPRRAPAGRVGPRAAGGHQRAATYFASAVDSAGRRADLLRRPGRARGVPSGLAAPGAPVIVEAPTYLGALTAARAHGLAPVPVPADERGVRPTCWPTRSSASARGSSYLQPAFANPHGASLAVERATGARRRARRGRVPDRGRRGPRPRLRHAPDRVRRRSATATSCTSARSPSPPRPACGSAR